MNQVIHGLTHLSLIVKMWWSFSPKISSEDFVGSNWLGISPPSVTVLQLLEEDSPDTFLCSTLIHATVFSSVLFLTPQLWTICQAPGTTLGV